jgi:NADH dehydrogenase
VQITLIDRRNHHLFQPLLYEVAAAALNPSDIAVPLRKILRDQPNVTVLLGEATGVDVDHKRLLLADQVVDYDYLIIATGARHSYFGNDEWAEHAPGLKSISDALEIRRRVLVAFEAAEREDDPVRQQTNLTFVVIGGGPTGVELAGVIAELSQRILAEDFRRCDPTKARVLLLEGIDRILPPYCPELSAKAKRELEKRGVEVRTSSRVTRIEQGAVWLGEEKIEARTILWAAGVQASSLARSLGAGGTGVNADRAGRVKIAPDLTVPGRSEIFVVGDASTLEIDGRPVPGVAPAAMQQGRHAARNLLRGLQGKPYVSFRYVDKGSLATIGRGAAVAQFGKVKLSGVGAWLLWIFVHLLYLVGFRNRVLVLFEWAWAYLAWERGARLITGERHPISLRYVPESNAAGPSAAPTTSPVASSGAGGVTTALSA